MRPAAPYGDLRGRDGPLAPSPLTAAATLKYLGGEGVEDMGDGGRKPPPIPLRDSHGHEGSPSRGRHWVFERHPPFFATC